MINKNKGITLIALVVTIIILIILATVSINMVVGENGLIKKAEQARDAYEESSKREEDNFEELANEFDDLILSKKPETVEDAIKRKYTFETNTEIKDEYDNPITVPAGFHIVTPSEDNTVVYDYSDKKGIPTVQDGIVIADEEENQFVWIPVSTEKRKIKDKNNGETEIILGRYTFSADGTPSSPKTDGTEMKLTSTSTYFCTEETEENHTYKNTIAKSIEDFKKSANEKGGYYLARHEASYNATTQKPYSRPSVGTPQSASGVAPTLDRQLWNNIKQPEAAEKARDMYTAKTFESDLVNSYAWDTAIVFIQKYGGEENKNYSVQIAKNHIEEEYNNQPTENTGERTNSGGKDTTDKVCNIYDMASNCWEFSTETLCQEKNPCVYRGGAFYDKNRKTGDRWRIPN